MNLIHNNNINLNRVLCMGVILKILDLYLYIILESYVEIGRIIYVNSVFLLSCQQILILKCYMRTFLSVSALMTILMMMTNLLMKQWKLKMSVDILHYFNITQYMCINNVFIENLFISKNNPCYLKTF